jgi:hypothetical protein
VLKFDRLNIKGMLPKDFLKKDQTINFGCLKVQSNGNNFITVVDVARNTMVLSNRYENIIELEDDLNTILNSR